MDDNVKQITKSENQIKPQVPGITTQKEKRESATPLREQELYWRATNYIGC